MKHYQIIEHTADVRLKIKASSYEELFEAGLEGMSQILKNRLCKKYIEFPLKLELAVSSADVTSLLIDFLSDVLTLSHIHNAIFCKVVFQRLTPTSLKTFIHGRKIKAFDEDIKAVSYHEAEITKDKEDYFKTNIIFDI